MTMKIWVRLFVIILISLTLVPLSSSTGQAQGIQFKKLFLPMIVRHEPPVWMGPYGGSIVALASAPSQRQIVYAGTGQAGVFRSDDGGVNWHAANNGISSFLIDSLAVHPVNSQVVYAGTHGAGMYRTRDGGRSWQEVNNGIAANSVVYTLAVNPGNPNLIFAGTRIKGTYYHGVLYKSVDAGDSWESVLEFSDDWVYSVAVNPNAPNIVAAAVHGRGPYISHNYGGAGTWQASEPPDSLDSFLQDRWLKGRAITFDPRLGSARVYYGSWHNGFLSYSPNNGGLVGGVSSWIMATGAEAAHVYPNGISVKPSAPTTAYFAGYINGSTPNGDLPGGVWRTDNAGASWYATGLRGKYTYSVAASVNDAVIAGTYSEGLYRSTNGGSTWNISVNGLANSLVTGMVFTGSQTIYASTTTGGGVWKSTDGGMSWNEYNSGLADTWVNGLVLHPGNPNILYALTRKAGLQRIDLRTGSWMLSAAAPLDPGTDGMLPLAPGLMNAQDTVEMDLQDAGDEIGASEQLVLLNAISQPVLSLRFAPTNSNTAYLATEGGGMYKSIDGGVTWQLSGLTGVTVRDIAVDPFDANTLYAAVVTAAGATAQKSIDGGVHWMQLPALGTNVTGIGVLAIDPSNRAVIYAGTNSGVFVYDGVRWSNAGLDGLRVNAIGFSPGDPSFLYAATDQGVYYRLPYSSEWMLLDPQLLGVSAQSLNFKTGSSGYLYVGTSYHGTLRVQIRP